MKRTDLSDDDVKYITASIKERLTAELWSNKKGNINITHSSPIEGKDSWDICFTSANTLNYIAELKVRDRFSSDFEETENQHGKKGWMFEKIKYDDLIDKCSTPHAIERNLKPLFIIFFKDCICIWDVLKIKPEDFTTDEYRKSSVTGSKSTRSKAATYLFVKDIFDGDQIQHPKYRVDTFADDIVKAFYK